MAKELRFGSKKEAEDFAAGLDALAGYPKAGIRVTPGKHVPREQAITLRLADVEERVVDNETIDAYPLAREVRAYADEEVTKPDGQKVTVDYAAAVSKDSKK